MTDISRENKILARIARNAFSGTPKVVSYYDEKEENSIDILTCEKENFLSYSTIGLSDHPLFIRNEEYSVRLELVGASYNNIDYFENVLATASFNIINSKMECYPGKIFDNIISMYDSSKSMKHILFVPPFVWDDKLETIQLDGKKVAWLQAIPISDEERNFAQSNDSDKLEDLLEKHNADVYDLNRKSIL